MPDIQDLARPIDIMLIKEADEVDDNAGRGTTLTNDDTLVTVVLPLGWYQFELRFDHSSVSPAGFKYRFGGTATYAGRYKNDPWTGVLAQDATTALTSATTTTTNGNLWGQEVRGYFEVTVAGTFAFQWSQFSSSANDITVHKGSSLRVRSSGNVGI